MKIRPIQEGNARLPVLGREVASLVSQHLSVQVRVKRDKCPGCTQSVASERGTALQPGLQWAPCPKQLGPPLPAYLFLDDPFLQALGLVEEKPGKQDH